MRNCLQVLSHDFNQQPCFIVSCLFLSFCLNMQVQIQCRCLCSMQRNAVLVAERCFAAWAEFKFSLLSFSLVFSLSYPPQSGGTSGSSCFLAIRGQRCTLADLIGNFLVAVQKSVGDWTRLSVCVPRCWVTMRSAGRLADVCLVLQIQSCHCVESASKMCVFVCICG